MSKNVYAFRGSPASGKTTISALFCETLPRPMTFLRHDLFRWELHTHGRTVPEVSEADHALAFEVLVGAYQTYLRRGRHPIVAEGVFTYDDPASSQGNVEELRVLAEEYGYTFTSIVLSAAKDVILTRNAARSYSVPRDEFELLYGGVYGTVGSNEAVVDSTTLTVPQTLDQVLAATGALRVPEGVV
jgi:predicted kinase